MMAKKHVQCSCTDRGMLSKQGGSECSPIAIATFPPTKAPCSTSMMHTKETLSLAPQGAKARIRPSLVIETWNNPTILKSLPQSFLLLVRGFYKIDSFFIIQTF
jgi:hypothetical protein